MEKFTNVSKKGKELSRRHANAMLSQTCPPSVHISLAAPLSPNHHLLSQEDVTVFMGLSPVLACLTVIHSLRKVRGIFLNVNDIVLHPCFKFGVASHCPRVECCLDKGFTHCSHLL